MKYPERLGWGDAIDYPTKKVPYVFIVLLSLLGMGLTVGALYALVWLSR